MATDPDWTGVSILCPFTADYESVAGDDAGVYTIGTGIVETPARFGTGSMVVYGISDYWRADNTALLPSGTDDFTIEGHTYIDTWYNTVNTVANLYQSSSQGLRFSVLSDGTPRLELLDDFFPIVHPSTIPLNTWFHWAITREAGSFNLWIDGVGATARASSLSLAPTYLSLGAPIWSTSSDELDGFYNELRVTLGVARYSADFTAPIAAFPRYGWELEGRVYDLAGDPAARTLRAYRRDTGAEAATTTSDAGTGAFTLGFGASGEHSVVCFGAGDDEDLVQRAVIGE